MEQGDDSLALTRLNTLHVSPRQSGALVQSPAAFIGPGKTLHEIYSSLGAMAEKHANRAAHSLGMGPIAVGERLSTHFGDGGEREEALSGLRTNIPRKLAKDCARLMAYALPCETLTTQLEAFKSLITVITRYPGTRMILLDSKPPAGEEGDIAGLWDHPSEVCDREWAFHRKFAAACLADRDISSVVEAVEPQQLGSVSEHLAGLSIIERLLVFSDSDGQSHFSHQIAIRYLGGILELPSFWLQAGALHRTVVQKILARALLLLKDLGVDSPALDNSTAGVLDIDGTDILCDALLQGIQAWLPERFSPAITPETWYPSLYNVLQQLRQPRTEDLLPRSWAIATGGRLQEVVPSHYESRLVYMITTAPVQRRSTHGDYMSQRFYSKARKKENEDATSHEKLRAEFSSSAVGDGSSAARQTARAGPVAPLRAPMKLKKKRRGLARGALERAERSPTDGEPGAPLAQRAEQVEKSPGSTLDFLDGR